MLKKILLGFLILVVALLLIGFLLPAKVTMARSIEVAAPPERIYALLDDPRQWKRWTVWNERDPDMAITYSGPERGAGAGWSWTSASEGNGAMTFTAADSGRLVAYELRFEGFDTPSAGALTLEPTGTGTRVTWAMDADMGGSPVNRWFGVFMPGMMRKDFDGGLANLKRLAEAGS